MTGDDLPSWVMGYNWTKKDLVAVLRTEFVRARELVPGDVIVADPGTWQVARIERLPRDAVSAIDEDDKNVTMPGDMEIQIVLRSALRPR